ncbi:hypothetical protein SAMN04489740_3105 [Arthrobacter alpinus]|uniref:Transmembrane protein n=1 Tax=Arthrobacter alpinus TaxID=656366 RepID=A0A1H5MS40_9MICC|nr:hypothetical protein [Arthrobacter alpinus]SEE92106.1 hypothetical protein SAMN04489740_3105 [Arthrobacter alpinus]
MPAVPLSRRRVEFVLVPLVAAFCMAFIIGALVLDRDSRPCPQPNWNNQLSVSLSGSLESTSNVSAITACAGTSCTPAEPTFAKGSSGNTSVLVHQQDGTWLLTLGAQPPSAVSFRLFDENGTVLAAQSTALNWTRVTGDERCGGRMAGISLMLNVP